MTSDRATRRRRIDGWGFEDDGFAAAPELVATLEAELGRGVPQPRLHADALAAAPDPRPLPDLGVALSTDPLDRLTHARGQGLLDLLRLRTGTVPALPDAVARPVDAGEVARLVAGASEAGVRLVPRGGGTSVTGAVNVVAGDPPTVVLDLERVSGLRALDPRSRLATFGAGTAGPALEAALGEHGLTLGHFPQSFELSTLGGWIATRASGQESLAYGGIERLVAGVEVVAPAGRLVLPPLPSTAAGPDLRQLVLGSEGRLGVITEATVRVAPRPARTVVEAFHLPSFGAGIDAVRTLVQAGVPLSLLRLSDEPETATALAIGLGGHGLKRTALKAWLGVHRRSLAGCLLLVGAGGDPLAVDRAHEAAGDLLAGHRAIALGGSAGDTWLRDRFRHPYLRDALLDLGWATETLETAAPWSRLPALADEVRSALANALRDELEPVRVLCHVSHPYPDGASLYFTFFFRCDRDVEVNARRWAALKRAATEAMVRGGGTISHHHGVGTWHAPWLAAEVGDAGVAAIAAAAASLDPQGVLNPHALLDPTDRLTA